MRAGEERAGKNGDGAGGRASVFQLTASESGREDSGVNISDPEYTAAPAHLRWDHLRAEDVPAWAELTNLCARADGTEEFYQEEDLAEELHEAGFTPELDSIAVWDRDTLVAYGQTRVSLTLDGDGEVRCNPDGGVHPDWRGRGIGSEILSRQEVRARELAAERFPDAPAHSRVSGGLEGSDRRPFLAARGYEIVRYFQLLTRPLPGDELVVETSSSARLVCPQEGDAEAVRVAHNAAFADHWGSAPQTPERWADHWRARAVRRELSTLAVDGAGAVLCYVIASEWVPGELYIDLVGTVPSARGQGLAAACIARTVALAVSAGKYGAVELDVDADSPTGATRLYERLGFEVKKTFATMQRAL